MNEDDLFPLDKGSPVPPEWNNPKHLEDLNQKTAAFRKQMSEITYQVFAEFIQEKVGDISCLLCKEGKLSLPLLNIYGNSTGKSLYPPHVNYSQFLTGDESSYSPDSHEYSLICKNCGYTMKINTAIVLAWYNNRENQK